MESEERQIEKAADVVPTRPLTASSPSIIARLSMLHRRLPAEGTTHSPLMFLPVGVLWRGTPGGGLW